MYEALTGLEVESHLSHPSVLLHTEVLLVSIQLHGDPKFAF